MGGSGWAAWGGQAPGLPPQAPLASISWSACCFSLGQLWVLSLFMYTHVPGTASLDTLTPFQPGPRLFGPPAFLHSGPAPHAPGWCCMPLQPAAGLPCPLPGGLCTPAADFPQGRSGLRCRPRSVRGLIKQQPGAGLELGQNAGTRGGRQAGHQTHHLRAASSCFPLKLLGLQKLLGSPGIPGKRIYYLLKNRFPVLTRGV